MENVIALWLTLNGSAWGTGSAWALATSLATLAVPADTPRIRLASDTVLTVLHALSTLVSRTICSNVGRWSRLETVDRPTG